MGLAIGVDLGGTKIAAGVVDETGGIVAEVRMPTPADAAASVVAAIVDVCRDLSEQHSVVGVCVAAPGFVDAGRSRLLFTPNLPMADLSLRAEIEHALRMPVVIENDANAAAWGEFRFGAARLHRNAVVLTVGTGLGGGLVVDGRLVRGAYGLAAEVGHVTLVPDGLPCGCGLRGCWEQYASGSALLRIGRELAATRRADAGMLLRLGDGTPEGVQGEHITAAAAQGCPVATAAYAQLADALGRGMASLSALLDPEVFVIGGGVSAAGELLLAPARKVFEEHLTARRYRPLASVVGATLGNEAGLIGAADLARSA